MYFSFDFVWYTIHLVILSVNDREVGGRRMGGGWWLLNGQNPLRVTKIICRQSLTST